MTALLAVGCGLLGVLVGALADRAAARFPWGSAEHAHRRSAVGTPLLEIGTALLFALTAWRFGATWELPAFLFLAGAGVLLTVIDVQHRLLPNRVVLPSLGIGAALLTVAAAAEGAWGDLLRAGLAAVVLFAVFLVLALISPRSLGMVTSSSPHWSACTSAGSGGGSSPWVPRPASSSRRCSPSSSWPDGGSG